MYNHLLFWFSGNPIDNLQFLVNEGLSGLVINTWDELNPGFIQHWRTVTNQSPIELSSGMKLTPYYDLISDPVFKSNLKEATKEYLHGILKYRRETMAYMLMNCAIL